MKLKLYIFLALLLFIISSCKKEKIWFPNTRIEGVVIDNVTNLPVKNAEVILGEIVKYFALFGYTSEFEKIKSKTTDDEGKFKIKFSASKNDEYRIVVEKENYFKSTELSVEKGENKENVEISIIPKAYIKLHIKNINPVDNNDFFYFSYEHGNASYWGCNSLPSDLLGDNVDITGICETQGGGIYKNNMEV